MLDHFMYKLPRDIGIYIFSFIIPNRESLHFKHYGPVNLSMTNSNFTDFEIAYLLDGQKWSKRGSFFLGKRLNRSFYLIEKMRYKKCDTCYSIHTYVYGQVRCDCLGCNGHIRPDNYYKASYIGNNINSALLDISTIREP